MNSITKKIAALTLAATLFTTPLTQANNNLSLQENVMGFAGLAASFATMIASQITLMEAFNKDYLTNQKQLVNQELKILNDSKNKQTDLERFYDNQGYNNASIRAAKTLENKKKSIKLLQTDLDSTSKSLAKCENLQAYVPFALIGCALGFAGTVSATVYLNIPC